MGDVLSVAFSADNRQIVSASRDKTIKLWNTLAQCKYTIQEDGHQDWVSTVRFSPNNANPIIVSAGWDKDGKASCGTSTTASICTPWTIPTPSTPSPSPPTGTGCAPQLAPPSRCGTLRARTWWRSCDQRCLDLHVLNHHSLSLLPGVLTGRHCL